MRWHKLLMMLMCLIPCGSLASCGNGNQHQTGGKPVVLCTIFSYYDAARAIGGDAIDARILLPPSSSPHEYEVTVGDKVTASKAQLYIKNGMGLDDRFDKLLDGSSAKMLDIGKGIPSEMLLTTEQVSLDPASAAPAHPNATGHILNNPHIWLDPMIQVRAAELIRDALIELDEKNKNRFEENANRYIDDIEQLDKDFRMAVPHFKTRDFVGFHSAYDYLAHRYGLRQIASIEEVPEGGLSIGQAEKVIRLIQEHHIQYIAIETALSGQGAKLIIDRTGVKPITLQPLETYDKVDDHYTDLMRQNLGALKTALGG